MSYSRPVRYEEGQTLIACSICGFPYLFPSEMRYRDDRTFRCLRTCNDAETKLANDRKQTASMKRRDQVMPPLTGPKPSWR